MAEYLHAKVVLDPEIKRTHFADRDTPMVIMKPPVNRTGSLDHTVGITELQFDIGRTTSCFSNSVSSSLSLSATGFAHCPSLVTK